MSEHERLRAALIAQDELICKGQADVERYLVKKFEAAELVGRLIKILDGPEQRRARRMATEALAEG